MTENDDDDEDKMIEGVNRWFCVAGQDSTTKSRYSKFVNENTSFHSKQVSKDCH